MSEIGQSEPSTDYYVVRLPPREVRQQRGRMGGLATSAKHDMVLHTAPARQAFKDRFLDEVDPDRVLPEPERIRRAEAARKLHYTRMAYRSAQVRRARKKS